jgi:hypothetical protein
MTAMAREESAGDKQVSFWQVFCDDVYLLFFLHAAIFFISYTVWGLIELGAVHWTTVIK